MIANRHVGCFEWGGKLEPVVPSSLEWVVGGEGKPTHTLVPCWMTAALPPRTRCLGCFAPAVGGY